MSSTLSPATNLEPALRAILGDAIAPGDASYTVDGLVPSLVAAPESVEQLAAALAAADGHAAALIPWGGGRHMALGNVPSRYDVALLTTKLDRVVEYEPADLVLTVEAGMTMGRLQALLAEHGQFLPIDAPPEATVGGVLAAGVSGPSRHAYGLPRDWLIGCRVAHVNGTISKGGGRVVKNVAGYDLPKLAVGSLGTLGVIVEATFKVAPLPPAQETLLVHLSTFDDAVALVLASCERDLALRAVAIADTLESPHFDPHAEESQASFWLAGPSSAMERTKADLTRLAARGETSWLNEQVAPGWWYGSDTCEFLPLKSYAADTRTHLPPSATFNFMRQTKAAGLAAHIATSSFAYPTTGLVETSFSLLDAGTNGDLIGVVIDAQRFAVEAGGSLVVAAAPVEVKQRVDVWGDVGSALPLMRRLKAQFDARGTLNPGRFVGGL
jgi:glycolate oxidase FAD binding subunit